MKVSGVGTSYREWPAVSGISKTLMGCMKLIVEWASLVDEPFNITDEIALDAKQYLEALKMPLEVVKEISEYQEDMPVYRYLSGVKNPRNNFIEQTVVSPLFLKWLKTQLRYLSLNALVANIENTPTIDENILRQEKEEFDKIIYSNAHRYLKNENSITIEYLFEILKNPNSLTEQESHLLKKALICYDAL